MRPDTNFEGSATAALRSIKDFCLLHWFVISFVLLFSGCPIYRTVSINLLGVKDFFIFVNEIVYV